MRQVKRFLVSVEREEDGVRKQALPFGVPANAKGMLETLFKPKQRTMLQHKK